jgi:D-arabinose 1-dehydrogenase-like Zn-dependent alcohol dehydrogenase
MPRAIVFKGDETWELREVPKPKLRPACAVLRVEAVGICHSDVDQFRGHAPEPSGGVFPTVPGHEIVGRIEQISPEAAAEFGVQEGDRVGVRPIVVTSEGKRGSMGSTSRWRRLPGSLRLRRLHGAGSRLGGSQAP